MLLRKILMVRGLAALAAALLGPALAPGSAGACLIDNTASLSANGVSASLTLTTASNVNLWAPFTVARAFASGAPVQLSESRTDLARSLPAATLAAPYRWSLGDGATLVGHVVTHRFARPGLYKIMVYGYYGRRAAGASPWAAFDSVLLQVVPPGQVAAANQRLAVQRAAGAATTAYLWLLEGALVLAALVAAGVVLLRRRSPPAGARAGEARDRPAGSATQRSA